MKIVINRCFGGFGLSQAGQELYFEFTNKPAGKWVEQYSAYEHWAWEIERNDPHLVRVVENLGEKSWGTHSELKVVEIPDDVAWYIDSYDGMETVHEEHRSWY